MKPILYTLNRFFLGLMTVILVSACSDDNTSDLRLNGETWLETFQLDNLYEGIIDHNTRTVIVGIPEYYNAEAMIITAITASEGAETSIKAGDVIDFTFAQTVKVTNGDAFLNYTITVKHDEARITSFKLNDTYTGIIDETNKTILVRVPSTIDITNLVPTIVTSAGATVTPVSGQAMNFSQPVVFTVTYQTATSAYTVTAEQSDAPKAVYVGLASSVDQLNPEEKAAAMWMLQNIASSQYISFEDVRTNRVDLRQCKLMWWHFHVDYGINSMADFEKAAPDAKTAITKIKEFYENGGNLLLTRYATYYASEIGATGQDRIPNNCWGGKEDQPETIGGAWSFNIQEGCTDHPLYNDIDKTDNKIFTFDAGYGGVTNTTAQYHVDWDPYKTYDGWKQMTGAVNLAYGDPNTVVIWEFEATENKGGILCIGSGTYDWYSKEDASADPYHGNVAKLTENAIHYLTNK